MLASLLLLAQSVAGSSGLDRTFEYQCPGLEDFQIQLVHHVDSGGGTIRSKATGRSLGIGVGPMVEELAPRRRPAGYRWYTSETVGVATVTYGLASEPNLVHATIIGAPMSKVVNLAGKPEDQALLLSVARILAASQCTWTRIDP
jgi:hypothetical protein